MSGLIVCQKNADRETWLKARTTGIGASEAASVLGVNPWCTPLELYWRKLGLLEQEQHVRFRVGLALEPLIHELYVEATGREIERPEMLLRHPKAEWVLASLDRRAVDRPVEFKTVSIRMASSWGPDGSDEIPDYYHCQVQQQMAVTGHEIADVAALIGNDDFRVYTVERNDDFIDGLIAAEFDFWQMIQMQEPPLPDFEHPTTVDLLAKLEADETKAIGLSDAAGVVASRYERLGQLATAVNDARDRAKAFLLHALGDAGLGLLSDGRTIERKKVERKAYSVAAGSYYRLSVKTPGKRKGKKNAQRISHKDSGSGQAKIGIDGQGRADEGNDLQCEISGGDQAGNS